jgi:hypothetical protein
MENRRRDYRHHFPHPSGLRAELASDGPSPVRLTADIVDLSIGGAALQIDEQTVGPAASRRWTVQLSLPTQAALSMSATCAHQRANGPTCGFQFLPLADPLAQDDRERIIWRFLLEEQRKARRRRDDR